jgi:hypothetical protein
VADVSMKAGLLVWSEAVDKDLIRLRKMSFAEW